MVGRLIYGVVNILLISQSIAKVSRLSYIFHLLAYLAYGKRTSELVNSYSTNAKVVATWQITFLQAAL
jgi:hypothetical protein